MDNHALRGQVKSNKLAIPVKMSFHIQKFFNAKNKLVTVAI